MRIIAKQDINSEKRQVSAGLLSTMVTLPSAVENLANLSLIQLKGSAIARILPLRQQIDLSAATAIDPAFLEHEKKEIS